MKICRIVKNFPPLMGGMEYHARDLSYAQAKKGHFVDVFIMRGSPHTGDERVKIRRIRGEGVANKLRDSLGSMLFMSLVDSHLVIRRPETTYDIFHLHGDIMEALFGALLGKVYGKPTVITLHAGLNTRKVYRTLASRSFGLVDHIIAVSEDIAKEVVEMGLDPARISVISSGIHYQEFANGENLTDKMELRRRLGLPEESPLVVGVGRLHPMKGFKYLIEALTGVEGRIKVAAAIVGGGPEEPELIRLGRSGTGRIIFTGQVEKAQLRFYLLAADVFVLPSVSLKGQREGTPTAVMEAMAAGLPVVTTDVGGAKKLIGDGINGFLVPEKDPKAIRVAIEKLISQPSLRRAMGENNKKEAKKFDWGEISSKVESVYRTCLAKRKGKSL